MSGFWLKILAMISMLIDHTGMVLFPQMQGLRVLGRLGRLQLPAGRLEEAARRHKDITGALAPWFDGVLLDLAPRKEE